jgi:hypothetical protein
MTRALRAMYGMALLTVISEGDGTRPDEVDLALLVEDISVRAQPPEAIVDEIVQRIEPMIGTGMH